MSSEAAAVPPLPRFGEREFGFDDRDFAFIVRLVRERTGIVLTDHKRDMVYGRLARRLRQHGMRDFEAYCRLLAAPGNEEEVGLAVNAITTNLTRFFREPHHFEHLGKVALPEIMRRPDRRLRLWSAGSSSGEEPYSMAMVLRDAIPDLGRWDARILATDINTEMVARGREGIYDGGEIESVPPALRQRYFAPLGNDRFQAAESLRSLIAFKPLNLLGTWPMRGRFDVVFCRNVVIYFDRPTQASLFERLADVLVDGGYLYIGHSETLVNVTDRYTLIGKSIYRKRQ